MHGNRRQFLTTIGGLSALGSGLLAGKAHGSAGHEGPADPRAVLLDLTLCVGCRHCEHACRKAHAPGSDPGSLESYEDTSVFEQERRPSPEDLTVVNAFQIGSPPATTIYAKVNCLHCNRPACVSACIVGALEKQDNGAVTYDAWKCIGCRYCMVACPFQIPAYEYNNALTPKVRKCDFCVDRQAQGQMPACVEACPRQAMIFGRRAELLRLAHERIAQRPGQYVDHVYGEHEVGGTSWLYLSPMPFDKAGFLTLGAAAPSALTEAIQHGVFKHWIAPVALYGVLGASMYVTRTRRVASAESHGHAQPDDSPDDSPEDHATPAAVIVGGEAGGGAAVAMGAAVAQPRPLRGLINEWLRAPPAHHGTESDAHAAPVERQLLTPGVWALLAMVAVGLGFGLYRFIFGLGATTNLDQQHPWGLWIAMDVGSGIALAGGGFVTAALVHIFHREHYHAVARSALLTALLGYTFYVPGLLADLGRWYNLWHPTLPSMWQVNSVLFEVGICVMLYLNVQYAELCPIVCERLARSGKWPRVARWARVVHGVMERVMPAFLILGVTLSCFHQSSLGNLMVIAPYKLHALWWTPVAPVMFLLSAMMVGFPVVIFTILFASRCLGRRPEMHVLGPLSRYAVVFLAAYLLLKVGDVAYRGVWVHLLDGSLVGVSWLAEMVLGVVLPLVMLTRRRVRESPGLLMAACLAVVLGVVLNRLNVFVIGYAPPFAERSYFPSVTEFALSMGLIAALMLTYRVAVTFLPILEPRNESTA